MRVLVTGGTGQLGGVLTQALVRRGHTVRVLSRQRRPADSDVEWARGDLTSGGGVVAATQGVDAVVHAASDPRNSATVDAHGTTLLLQACRRGKVRHLVYVSIIGIDRIPLPYYGHKLEAERAIEAGAVPYSILRAAQFHVFVDFLFRRACSIPLFLPTPAGVRVQSIGVEEVAEHLSDIVEAPAGGRHPDLVGPEALSVAAAARVWVHARRLHRLVVPVPVPGRLMKALRRGHNVDPLNQGRGPTWAEWVASRYSAEPAA